MRSTEPRAAIGRSGSQVAAGSIPAGIHLRPLQPSDADALCDVLLAARAVDGPHDPVTRDELRHHWFDHPAMHLETDSLAAVTSDGALVGAIGVFARDAPTTLARAFMPGCVHPDHRRRGIGTALLERGVEHARDLLSALPGEHECQVDGELPATAPDRIALFEREGFRRARSFVEMHRDLREPIPSPAVVAGLTFVTWSPDLDEATRLAHNDAFRDHWGSDPLPADRWRHFVGAMPGFRGDCSWLAVEAEPASGADQPQVVGYTLATINDESAAAPVGWLGTIGVRRSWRQRGIASALILRSLASCRASGAATVGLDVDADNPSGAVRVYEALGFERGEELIIFSRRLEPSPR